MCFVVRPEDSYKLGENETCKTLPVETIASVCYVCSVFGQSRFRLHHKTKFG